MSDTQKSSGVCVIDYEQMQARADGKYDVWQGDISSRFDVKLECGVGDAYSNRETVGRA